LGVERGVEFTVKLSGEIAKRGNREVLQWAVPTAARGMGKHVQVQHEEDT
jgi:hypothetical protein